MAERCVCLDDFENVARTVLEKTYFEYIADGCDRMVTRTDNRQAFTRYRFRPQLLRDVSNLDIKTTVLGEDISCPIAIGPTSFHRMVDKEGEKATARASYSAKTLMVLSAFSNTRIEDVAMAAPGLYWMHIQFFKDRRITEQLVRRADAAGYKALIVTIDQPVIAKRNKIRFKLKSSLRLINLEFVDSADLEAIISQFKNNATWNDIGWLKTITKLPIAVKGIITDTEARNAVLYGVDAILVSNHGGRQLDYLPATIDALPEVVAAVEGSGVEVYMDGGVRSGSDVFKALARGARAVFIGRPIMWGLACNGEEGVKSVIDILKEELNSTMGLMGCSKLNEITPSMVVHERYYYNGSK